MLSLGSQSPCCKEVNQPTREQQMERPHVDVFNNWLAEREREREVAQLCLTPSDPMDCTLPGSSVHGIFQARVLEWVAISFSNAWKWKVKVKTLSRVQLLATPWAAAYQAPLSMGFSRWVLEWGAIAFGPAEVPANSQHETQTCDKRCPQMAPTPGHQVTLIFWPFPVEFLDIMK